MIVNINPLYREAVPVSAQDIQNRINEISFNTSLLRELRAIEFVQRLVDAGTIPQGAMKRVLTHMIADDDLMTQLSVATKLVPTPAVLFGLKARGRAAMEAFLAGQAHSQPSGLGPGGATACGSEPARRTSSRRSWHRSCTL